MILIAFSRVLLVGMTNLSIIRTFYVKTLLDELACGSKRLHLIIESNLCNKDRSTPLFSHGHLGKLVFTNCSNRNLIPVQQLPLSPDWGIPQYFHLYPKEQEHCIPC